MSIHAVCPGCGKTIKAPDGSEGKKAKCKLCGAVFVLDEADEGIQLAPEAAPPPPSAVRPRPEPRAEPESADNRLLKIVIGGAALVMLVAIGIVLGLHYNKKANRKTEFEHLQATLAAAISDAESHAAAFDFDRATSRLTALDYSLQEARFSHHTLRATLQAAHTDLYSATRHHQEQLAEGYVVFERLLIPSAERDAIVQERQRLARISHRME